MLVGGRSKRGKRGQKYGSEMIGSLQEFDIIRDPINVAKRKRTIKQQKSRRLDGQAANFN
ncbi:MAG: hypothetical protein H7335_07595 [Massilia sp.]|nr:hypothetical protein [Massilia sp.]